MLFPGQGYSFQEAAGMAASQQLQSQENEIAAGLNQKAGNFAEFVADQAAQQAAVVAATYYFGPGAGRIVAAINFLTALFDIETSPPSAGGACSK